MQSSAAAAAGVDAAADHLVRITGLGLGSVSTSWPPASNVQVPSSRVLSLTLRRWTEHQVELARPGAGSVHRGRSQATADCSLAAVADGAQMLLRRRRVGPTALRNAGLAARPRSTDRAGPRPSHHRLGM
jgi:hypothetical protein